MNYHLFNLKHRFALSLDFDRESVLFILLLELFPLYGQGSIQYDWFGVDVVQKMIGSNPQNENGVEQTLDVGWSSRFGFDFYQLRILLNFLNLFLHKLPNLSHIPDSALFLFKAVVINEFPGLCRWAVDDGVAVEKLDLKFQNTHFEQNQVVSKIEIDNLDYFQFGRDHWFLELDHSEVEVKLGQVLTEVEVVA